MDNIRQQYESMLEGFLSNRAFVFPPPNSNSSSLYERLNSRYPRNRLVTGRGLLRYFVSLRGELISISDSRVITKVTDQLWMQATRFEKSAYIYLACEVNELVCLNLSQRIDFHH